MVYRLIARLLPKRAVKNYEEMLFYANIKLNPEKFIGFVILFGLGLALAVAFDFAFLFKLPLWPTLLISFAAIEVFAYMWLLLGADARAKFIENMLPDALQLMASNLRAGFTTDKALLLSAREEFGPLKEELDIVAKEVVIGKDISEALINMTKRVKSEKFKKAILLIVSGLKSGGELASLLGSTAKNLTQQRFVEEMVRSSVLTYTIFIFAAVGIGAPLLFGLSSFLVEVLTNVLSAVQIPETVGTMSLPITIKGVAISSKFIITYSIVSLVTTSIMASMVIGLVRKGREKEGVKILPLLIILTVAVFFMVRYGISLMLSGLFTI